MIKIKKEEIFLLIMGILFWANFLFFYGKKIDFSTFLIKQSQAFSASMIWFIGFLAAFLFYFIFKMIAFAPQVLKNGMKSPKELFATKNYKTGENFSFWDYFRTIVLILFIFSLFMFALAGVTGAVKNRLLNQQFLDFEQKLFGEQPFLMFFNPKNPLTLLFRLFSGMIIWCFQSMSLFMGISVFAFYLLFDRKDFFKYIFAIFISALIALPLWYSFPVNSPNNFYLSKNPTPVGYNIGSNVLELQKEIREEQKNSMPISTFPSMHTTWGILMVYYLYKNYKKSIIVFGPWLFFMILGTFYLGQHYLVDILMAFPIAILTIFLSEQVSKITN
jgi:membrane-associated phospholipid phosphatase